MTEGDALLLLGMAEQREAEAARLLREAAALRAAAESRPHKAKSGQDRIGEIQRKVLGRRGHTKTSSQIN